MERCLIEKKKKKRIRTSRPTIKLQVRINNKPAIGASFVIEKEGDRKVLDDSSNYCFLLDKNGECIFDELSPGDYVIRLSGSPTDYPGYTAVPVSLNGLKKGEDQVIQVNLVEGTIISGYVTDSLTGAPVQCAEIRYQSDIYPFTDTMLQAANTDAQGFYKFWTPIVPCLLQITVSAFCKTAGDFCKDGVYSKSYQKIIENQAETRIDFKINET
ncbi:MAG: hypothetical protein V1872_05750 [bacterium]